MVACALGGSFYRRGSCRTFLKQNIVQRTFGGLEPWVKKMGPNSEPRSSSLKIRRKHFLSTIFRHLRINLGKNRTELSTSIINLFSKVLQACSYLHDSNETHQAYNGFAHLFMNLSAFSKIMKKYEKIASRRAARSYMLIVDNSNLGSSDEVTNLLERVETTFIQKISNSNRREGMKSLRPKAKRERHSVTFFSGFFSGCSIALLVAIVLRIEARKLLDKEEGAEYVENIFPLYSLFGYITLHMLMYAADIYFWRRYRVNYAFIFGFKKGTELGYREVFLLATGLAVLSLGGFLANLHLDLSAEKYKTVTELVPLGLLALYNVGQYRAFKSVPLPFSYYDEDADKED